MLWVTGQTGKKIGILSPCSAPNSQVSWGLEPFQTIGNLTGMEAGSKRDPNRGQLL